MPERLAAFRVLYGHNKLAACDSVIKIGTEKGQNEGIHQSYCAKIASANVHIRPEFAHSGKL
jgi:hypothetical protein